MIARKNARGGYAAGYGKPPVDTRFAKGQTGIPGGRPPAKLQRPLRVPKASKPNAPAEADRAPVGETRNF